MDNLERAKIELLIIVLILFLLLLLQVFYLSSIANLNKRLRKWGVPFFLTISAILWIVIQVVILGKMKLDLCNILMILAGLYGGFRFSYITFFITVIFQFFFINFDETHLLSPLTLSFIIASVVPLFSKKFLQFHLLYKLFICVAFIFIVTVSATLVIETKVATVSLFIVNISTMILSLLNVELIINKQSLLQRTIKTEKLEIARHLTASISHEVRNPLTASRGYMQLLYSEVHPSKHEYINVAIKEIDEAVNIIRKYLTFAKPLSENDEVINVTEELQHVLHEVAPFAKMHSIEIAFKKLNKDLYIYGDRQKLQQSITNIVNNGIESMKNGGKLEIDVSLSKKHICICIKDTGIGMSKEQINRLGEPYFSTKEKGTGLGMMLTYRIIESMGGKITVKSQLEKGTHFSIKLPLYEE